MRKEAAEEDGVGWGAAEVMIRRMFGLSKEKPEDVARNGEDNQ